MPHFSESGADEVICQLCARMVDTGRESVEWRPDLTGSEIAGNVCAKCITRAARLSKCPLCGGPGDGLPCAECSDEDGEREEPICMGCGTRCGTNGRCQE